MGILVCQQPKESAVGRAAGPWAGLAMDFAPINQLIRAVEPLPFAWVNALLPWLLLAL